eukprot:gnl/Chilomastix_caulleri/292.p1 GENE.gnl/Chilomastix_caulleri/292~~gnl/Chilomastix_caulleri/292.p1  ORF type:complete len:275 (+),score=107.65 gnl/Chilomastix_caulleri/292:79-825(+)
MTDLSREELVYLAKIQEDAERFEEMIETVKKIVSCGEKLNDEERNLLSIAYKNVTGNLRNAWRVLNGVEVRERTKGHEKQADFLEPEARRIVNELTRYNKEVIEMLDTKLIPGSESPECQVFYLKMLGDYWRYTAECLEGAQRQEAASKAQEAYSRGATACGSLPPTNSVALGLALNRSVFSYEILNSTDEAVTIARTAFDAAVARLDSLSDDSYKDATMILQLLRDNLGMWLGDAGDDNGDEADEVE